MNTTHIHPAQDFDSLGNALISHHYIENGNNSLLLPPITFKQGLWEKQSREFSSLVPGLQGLTNKHINCLSFKLQHPIFDTEFVLLPRNLSNPVIFEINREDDDLTVYDIEVSDCTQNACIDEEPEFQPILLGGILQLLLLSTKLSNAEKAIITHISNGVLTDSDALETDMWAFENKCDLLTLLATHRIHDFDWTLAIAVSSNSNLLLGDA